MRKAISMNADWKYERFVIDREWRKHFITKDREYLVL